MLWLLQSLDVKSWVDPDGAMTMRDIKNLDNVSAKQFSLDSAQLHAVQRIKGLVDPHGAAREGHKEFKFITDQFTDWFSSKSGAQTSIQKIWNPVAHFPGFNDCDDIKPRWMLITFARGGVHQMYNSDIESWYYL
ncbi:hypothetical protein L6164_035131 [Bauhinia variegata]|uniref:Uncharacterized protein n=1 Tax=Bauhinia variegata TaxID=167791 RepID=A0ACB9KWP0_BAUVA|nr:hypothetical protein L6164_035131 [Bauhinia variegata]